MDPRDPRATVFIESGPRVAVLAETRGGSLVASGDDAGGLSVFDLRGGQALWELKKAHKGPVAALAFDKSGSTLYSLGQDAKLRAWDSAKGVKPKLESPALGPTTGLWLGADQRFLYSAKAEGGLLPIKRQSLSPAKPLGLAGAAPCVALLALRDGHLLISQADGLLSYADPDLGVVRKVTLSAAALSLIAIKMEAEERYAVALLKDGQAVFVDLKDLAIKKQATLAGGEAAFAFGTHEAKRALLIPAKGPMASYRLPGGSLEASGEAVEATAACAVNQGNGVLLGFGDGGLRLYRNPGLQASFVAALDRADKEAAAGIFESAQMDYVKALQIFNDPGVRASLEKVKLAKKAAVKASRDKMKAMVSH